jgi:hypothetical protein
MSLTVTCQCGGAYGINSVVLVEGNVSGEVSNVSTITINVSKGGALKSVYTTTSDAQGCYYASFTSLDIGSYDVNVSATNTTHTAYCNTTFEIVPQQVSTECTQKTITVEGKTMYTTSGLVDSGNVFISIDGMTAKNITSFSNGNFLVSVTACLYSGKKYILHLSTIDSLGNKGMASILFTQT